jgi:death on curing protein
MPTSNVYFYRHRGRKYPTVKYILELHEDALEEAGGAPGINHQSVLESASRKAVESAGGEDAYPTLFWKVAAMGFTLAHDHGFRDGNKRTAMVTMINTLEENGYYPDTSGDAVDIIIVLVAMGLLNIQGLRVALLMLCDLEASDQES